MKARRLASPLAFEDLHAGGDDPLADVDRPPFLQASAVLEQPPRAVVDPGP
ncbi:hypothetical protein [Sorangium sp. So ce542]|uniref:hypothetical protein n=1 Tax=Sorangium sp. So ce542 TaxID=3133316 RepID=UPI003F619AE5